MILLGGTPSLVFTVLSRYAYPFYQTHLYNITHSTRCICFFLFSKFVSPNEICAVLLTQPSPLQISCVHLGVLEKKTFLKKNEAPGKCNTGTSNRDVHKAHLDSVFHDTSMHIFVFFSGAMQHIGGDNLGCAVEGAAHRSEAVLCRIPYNSTPKRKNSCGAIRLDNAKPS